MEIKGKLRLENPNLLTNNQMDESFTNFDRYCRICLSINENSNTDFIQYLKSVGQAVFFEKFPYLFDKKYGLFECFPKKICEKCVNSIKSTLEFLKLCSYSNEYLLRIVNEHTSNDWDIHKERNLWKCEYFRNVQLEESQELEDEDNGLTNEERFDGKAYKCNICSKVFKSRTGLKYHESVHNKSEVFKCETCEKEFNGWRNLRIHKLRHKEDHDYLCQECGKSFLTSSELNRHKRCHANEKNFSCKLCLKKFTTNKSLEYHLMRHEGKKNYSCEMCNKKFTTVSNLYEHKTIHLKEKPHKCMVCSKTWSSTSDLKKHLRTHNGEKPYKCLTCEKFFSRMETLRRHERSHSGIKSYNCDNCGKMFTYRCSLKKHFSKGCNKQTK